MKSFVFVLVVGLAVVHAKLDMDPKLAASALLNSLRSRTAGGLLETSTVGTDVGIERPPEPQRVWDALHDLHLFPKKGDDGQIHFWFREKNPNEPVEAMNLQTSTSVIDYLKHSHFIPKVATDGQKHFVYRPVHEVENSIHKAEDKIRAEMKRVSVFRSDISDTPLHPGDHFHKVGHAFDISGKEYGELPEEEKKKYVAITSQHQVEQFVDDYMMPPEATAEESGFRSDISHEKLVLGKWYHKVGVAYDITEAEFARVPSNEKGKFVRLDDKNDLTRFAHDWEQQAPATAAAPVPAVAPAVAPVPAQQPAVAIPAPAVPVTAQPVAVAPPAAPVAAPQPPAVVAPPAPVVQAPVVPAATLQEPAPAQVAAPAPAPLKAKPATRSVKVHKKPKAQPEHKVQSLD